MEKKVFDNSSYLVVIGWDGGGYECYNCASEHEVFTALTDMIHEEVDYIINNTNDFKLWDNPDETRDFAEVIMATKEIQDPDVIIDCFKTFISSSWWFTVIDNYGDTWFKYTPEA